MEFSHEGLTLWYGTDDAPAPEGSEQPRRGVSLTVGVTPPNPSNTVAVRFKVDNGAVQTTPARLAHTDYSGAKQYFRATFPEFWTGQNVEYVPVLSCAGRQAPDVLTASVFPSSFRLGAAPDLRRYTVNPSEDGHQSAAESPQQARFPLNLEYLGTATAQLSDTPEIIGVTPEGIKVNWYLTGGAVVGPKLNARIRPVGGDWMTIRPDGVGILGIRATIETHDGALVYTTYSGVFELGEQGYQNFLDKKWPNEPTVRMAPRFFTAHPRYQWLNRLQCLGVGAVRMAELIVEYDLYAVR